MYTIKRILFHFTVLLNVVIIYIVVYFIVSKQKKCLISLASPFTSSTLGITFLRWTIYFVHFVHAVTVVQKIFME